MRSVRVLAFTGMLVCVAPVVRAQGFPAAPPPPLPEYPAAPEVVSVLIELDAPSVIAEMQSSTAQDLRTAAGQLRRVEASQDDVAARIGELRELYRVQRVMNGIAAEVPREALARIESTPGVKAVYTLRDLAPDLSGSTPLIGAPAVWSSLGPALTGRGIRIGIIDSGIDYLHVALGGNGNYANQNYSDDVAPWNEKVVGGIDLVGDDYDSLSSDAARRTPKPDRDPMDCMGHGTSVAAIAAGFGASGTTTYRGPYSPAATLDALSVAPGVAPEAQLYAIRVFGCSGTTVMVTQALEWAVDPNGDGDLSDHLDVVNVSIGADFALGDAELYAADAASLAGTIVVGAAGNAGDTYFIADGVGAANRAISVANSRNGKYRLDGFRVDSPSSIAGIQPAQASSQFAWRAMTAAVSGTLVYPPDQRTGCSAFSASNAALLAGKIALLDWSTDGCGSAVRADNAANAGAIGAILVHDAEVLEAAGIAGNARIPVLRTTQQAGNALKQSAGSGVTVTLGKSWLGTQWLDYSLQTDVIQPDSSRGPRIGDALLKPDLSAPGGPIFTAQNRSAAGGASGSGTSFAAPHVAGAAALLRQAHRDWTVEEIKAALINSAAHDLYSSSDHAKPQTGLGRAGAGRLDVAAAAALDVLAMTEKPAGAVNASFGVLEVGRDLAADLRLRIVNKAAAAQTLTLSFVPVNAVPGVTYSFPNGPTVNVAAHSSATVTVRLTAIANALDAVRDASVQAAPNGIPRHWISESSGYVVFTRPSASSLRLPVYAVIRAIGDRHSTRRSLDLGTAARHIELPLTGTAVASAQITPIVTAFEWHYHSVDEAATRGSLNAADINFVGITTDAKTVVAAGGKLSDAVVTFGLAMQGRWCTPNIVDANVYVDVGGDNADDYVIYLASSSPRDDLLTAVCPQPNGACVWNTMPRNIFQASQSEMQSFFTDVVAIPVLAKDIGLSESASRFSYRIVTFGYSGSKRWLVVDRTPVLKFDIAHPALSFAGGVVGTAFVDRGDSAIAFDYDPAGAAASSFGGVLLLHHYNGSGARAEVLPAPAIVQKRRAAGR